MNFWMGCHEANGGGQSRVFSGWLKGPGRGRWPEDEGSEKDGFRAITGAPALCWTIVRAGVRPANSLWYMRMLSVLVISEGAGGAM